ncbi:MAG: aldehyde ferredoxin oxidoreductase N-terminal domain-containing protein [Deinococcales bacterium]
MPAISGAKAHFEVDTILKEELSDEKIEIAQIGPSGESMSNFACVMTMSNRAWGRTGAGAVMGSKKLRAIVVRGNQRVMAADMKKAHRGCPSKI